MNWQEQVERMTAAWKEGRFDDLTSFFHPDVVLTPPGFEKKVKGRDPVVASYRDFMQQAKVISLETGTVQADETETTAVTVMPWKMKYEFGGAQYDESGWDLLVWSREGDRWSVVWRTMSVK